MAVSFSAVAALKTFVEKHGNDARNIKAKPTGASRVQARGQLMHVPCHGTAPLCSVHAHPCPCSAIARR